MRCQKEEEGEGSQREDVCKATFRRKILMANHVFIPGRIHGLTVNCSPRVRGEEVILQPHHKISRKNINAGVEDNDTGMEKVNKENFVESREHQRWGVILAKIQYSRRQDSRRWRCSKANYQRLRSSGNAMTAPRSRSGNVKGY
jgi:hypothetical protein